MSAKNKKKKILVVEDEKDVLSLLEKGLKEKGFAVDSAVDGEEALQKAKEERSEYTLYIFDIVLPKLDGREVVKHLRSEEDMTPVLFLTAMDKVEDMVEGLEIGADDYMVKPFDFEELIARVKALIRRAGQQEGLYTNIGKLWVDRVDRVVTYDDREIELTQREYQLLDFFLRHREMVLTREQISKGVWKLSYTGESNFVDVYVRHLRQKIWRERESPIRTVRGKGYMFSMEIYEREQEKKKKKKKKRKKTKKGK